MEDINDMTESYDEEDLNEMAQMADECIEEDDNEETESDGTKKTRIIRPKRQSVINFGDKCRARFVENDANIFFERKIQGKFEDEDGTESTDDNYRNDGYFGDILNVIKYVLSINVKEKLLHKKEINNLEEIKAIMKESEYEMKLLANEIVRAIKNNEILAEVTKELMDKGE